MPIPHRAFAAYKNPSHIGPAVFAFAFTEEILEGITVTEYCLIN
jgi:hypothetical protein